jgi:hypothetical protein
VAEFDYFLVTFRVHKRYSNVPYDYGTSKSFRRRWEEEEDEEDVVTGRGHQLSSVQVPGRSSRSSKPSSGLGTDNDDREDKESDKVIHCTFLLGMLKWYVCVAVSLIEHSGDSSEITVFFLITGE